MAQLYTKEESYLNVEKIVWAWFPSYRRNCLLKNWKIPTRLLAVLNPPRRNQGNQQQIRWIRSLSSAQAHQSRRWTSNDWVIIQAFTSCSCGALQTPFCHMNDKGVSICPCSSGFNMASPKESVSQSHFKIKFPYGDLDWNLKNCRNISDYPCLRVLLVQWWMSWNLKTTIIVVFV